MDMTDESDRDKPVEGTGTPGGIPEKPHLSFNLIVLTLAGVFAIITPLVFFIGGEDGRVSLLGMHVFGPEFTYAWAIPVLGVLLILFTLLADKRDICLFALADMCIGPVLIALPLIIAHHWIYKFDENDLTMAELFIGIGGDSWYLYLGGILSMVAGFLAIIFGYRLFRSIRARK